MAKHTIKIVQVLHYTSNGMSFFKLQSTWFLAPKFPFLMTPKTFILVFTNDSNTTKNLFFTKRVLKNVCTILLSSYLCRLLPKPKRILACKCHTKYVGSFEQICLHYLAFAASENVWFMEKRRQSYSAQMRIRVIILQLMLILSLSPQRWCLLARKAKKNRLIFATRQKCLILYSVAHTCIFYQALVILSA